MRVTDEFVAWIKCHHLAGSWRYEELLDMSGRIEKAHQTDVEAAYSRGVQDGIAADMEAEGLVRLPRDADDKPIRFGDKITVSREPGKAYEVTGFSYINAERTIWVMVYSLEKMRNVPLCEANSCHHYHPQTVEDMLTEMLTDAFPDNFLHKTEAIKAMVEEYAPKFQLKETE